MTANTPDAPSGSVFADAGAARRAIELALPMIEPTLSDATICGSGFLCIVVLDPGRAPGECAFEDAILAEHGLGERARWDADYAALARAKARLAWFSGQDGHLVQTTQAHSLRAGDSLLWGGVCLDGIVVGVSGAHPCFDEAFATAIAANLRAIAKQRHAAARARDELVAAPSVA